MTHAQLMRSELGESFDHLKQAATYAAGGVGSMGPRVVAAREYVRPEQIRDAAAASWEATAAALAPLVVAAKNGAREARKMQAKQMKKVKRETNMSGRRWPALVGLLAAGTAVGAAGAMVMRRRRRQHWDEYGVMDESMVDSAKGSAQNAVHKASAGVDKAMDSAARGAEKLSSGASAAAERAGERAQSATEAARRTGERATEKSDDLISRAGSQSRNSRS